MLSSYNLHRKNAHIRLIGWHKTALFQQDAGRHPVLTLLAPESQRFFGVPAPRLVSSPAFTQTRIDRRI